MNDKERLALTSIADYCDRAQHAKDRHFPTRELFDEDRFYCDGIAQYILQIAECVKDLGDSFMDAHPEIPWHQIRGTRNIIAHAYGTIDADEVWYILVNDLPSLGAYCRHLIKT